jgi:hypothetical protein
MAYRKSSAVEPERKFLQERPRQLNLKNGAAVDFRPLERLSDIRTMSCGSLSHRNTEVVMKYICLGYIQPGKLENMSENEAHAMLDECFDYDDELRANGHFAAGEALQPPDTATTLYWKNGKVAVTDGD